MLIGCGKTVNKEEKQNKNASKNVFTYENANLVKDITISKSEYGEGILTIYHGGSFDDRFKVNVTFEGDEKEYTYEIDSEKITIKSDAIDSIDQVNLYSNWANVYLRYLNSNQYAILYYCWADDLGWDLVGGEWESYYTPEEIAAQKKKAEERQKDFKQNFEMLKGTWAEEEGYRTIRFFEEENGPMVCFWDGTESLEGFKYYRVLRIDNLQNGEIHVGSEEDIYDIGWTIYMDEDGNGFIIDDAHYIKYVEN